MRPSSTATQLGQVPSGSPSTGCSQLRTLARMRAVDVLPGAAGAAEEVGVAHPVLGHRRAQRPHHVVLAPQLAEALRAVAAVQRLVRVGHRADVIDSATAVHRRRSGRDAQQPAPGCDGQAICGTPQAPLRAAASRP